MGRIRIKLREWALRYGLAEVVSLVMTIVGGWLASRTTTHNLVPALAATWCGNVGFFGTILAQDVLRAKVELRKQGREYNGKVLLKNLRALFIEFGLAEVLDSFLIRPYLLYKMPQITGNLTSGLIAGKFLADLTFYLPSILFYEWSKKRLRKF